MASYRASAVRCWYDLKYVSNMTNENEKDQTRHKQNVFCSFTVSYFVLHTPQWRPLVTTTSQSLICSSVFVPSSMFYYVFKSKEQVNPYVMRFSSQLSVFSALLDSSPFFSSICQYVGFKLVWVTMGGWLMKEWPLTSTRQDSGYEPLPWKGSAVQSVRMLSW